MMSLIVKRSYQSFIGKSRFFWRQRSKVLWLKEGEKNSKFFHNAALVRKQNNIINKLHSDDGPWMEGSTMVGVFVDYFLELFTTFQLNGMDSIIGLLGCRLTDGMK